MYKHTGVSSFWQLSAYKLSRNDLKLPDICLTGEEKPRKNLTQETCPDRGLRDKRACYHLLHSGGLQLYVDSEPHQKHCILHIGYGLDGQGLIPGGFFVHFFVSRLVREPLSLLKMNTGTFPWVKLCLFLRADECERRKPRMSKFEKRTNVNFYR